MSKPYRKPHRVHRWRIGSRETTPPGRILYVCGYKNCAATYVYDLRKVEAKSRKMAKLILSIFGDELTGQETTGL